MNTNLDEAIGRWSLQALALGFALLMSPAALAQTTAFSYQGRLSDGDTPANGSYDLRFTLWDALSGGTAQPPGAAVTVTKSGVPVSGGIFTAELDFGVSAFAGPNRFLEIGVRPAGGGIFTTVTPREAIGASRYTIRTIAAGSPDTVAPPGPVPSAATPSAQTVASVRAVGGAIVAGTPTLNGTSFTNNLLARLLRSTPLQRAAATQAPRTPQVTGGGISGAVLDLGGIAAPAVAATGQGRLYFDAASNKLKVSENGGAFVNLVGASGGGSGTAGMVPLWTSGTTLGDSVIAQASGNIGVGVAPQARFHVNGTSWFTGDSTPLPAAAGAGVAIGFSGVDGYLFGFDYGTLTPKNLVLNGPGGNVGIGVLAPTSRLEIAAQDGLKISGYQPYLTLSDTNASSKSAFMQSANGDAVLLTNSRAALTLKDVSGNVGIGTATPAHHLSISGGPGWTSDGWTGAISMSNGSAIGWYGNAALSRFGIGQSNGGLYFFRTGSDPGATNFGTTYDLIISDTGNLMQARDKGGAVKAMVALNESGSILRCYNGTLGGSAATTAPCGFSVSHLALGVFRLFFGFQVDDRFYSVSLGPDTTTLPAKTIQYSTIGADNTVLDVWIAKGDGTNTNSDFMVIVY